MGKIVRILKIIAFINTFLLLNFCAKAQSDYCNYKWIADSLYNSKNYLNSIEAFKKCYVIEGRKIDAYYIAVCFDKINMTDSCYKYLSLALTKGLHYGIKNGIESDVNFTAIKKSRKWNSLKNLANKNINKYLDKKVSEPYLRDKLLMIKDKDQMLRNNWQLRDSLIKENKFTILDSLNTNLKAIDMKNQEIFKEILNEYGWPGYSLVGVDGDNAAWLIVQHSDNDTVFQKECLPLIYQSAMNGESSLQNYAYLVDRILVNSGKKQLYGTQFRDLRVDNKFVDIEFLPIEDSVNVDKRRKCMGLSQIALYKKYALQRYNINKD